MGLHETKIAAAMAESWAPGIPVAIGDVAGWLHRGTTNRAVLLVGAHGFEGFCSYQTWRAFAALIAEHGPNVLRIDLPGEGDSLDPPAGSNSADLALRAIRDAVAWLRQETGVEDIAVAGLRLGGLLAVNALGDEKGVSRLALLAPPASGKAYARELAAQARVLATIKPGTGVSEGGVNLCGFLTTPAALECIKALSFDGPTALRAEKAFLSCVNADDAGAIVARLGVADAAARIRRFDGYDELMLGPTASKTPWALLENAAAWLAEDCALATPSNVKPSPQLEGDDFRETRLFFGPDLELAGVYCEPLGAVVSGAPVLLTNAGANNHAGWARMHVDYARRLARLGIPSLRYDAYGIGDSACERAGPRPLIYSDRQKRDLVHAVDLLAEKGHAGCVATGVCGGGYNAFHGVNGDARITHAILVNTLRFLWHPHDDLSVEESKILQPAGAYAAKAADTRQWKRVLTGEVSLARAATVAAKLAVRLARKMTGPLIATLGLDQGRNEDALLVRQMTRETLARGARIDLVYSENDPGREELARHFGREDRLMQRYPELTLTFINGSDHELTPETARETLFGLILNAARRAV